MITTKQILKKGIVKCIKELFNKVDKHSGLTFEDLKSSLISKTHLVYHEDNGDEHYIHFIFTDEERDIVKAMDIPASEFYDFLIHNELTVVTQSYDDEQPSVSRIYNEKESEDGIHILYKDNMFGTFELDEPAYYESLLTFSLKFPAAKING